MTPDAVLFDIRGFAGANRVRLSRHVRNERMAERGATYEDIRHALMNASRCVFQAEKGTWKAWGVDLAGDGMVLIVAIEDGVLVITFYDA